MKAATAKCEKCSGTGRIGTLAHIANGVCFACRGTGRVTISASARLADLEREAALDAGYDPFSGETMAEFAARIRAEEHAAMAV